MNGNYFDQFDEPARGGNYFDQFDEVPQQKKPPPAPRSMREEVETGQLRNTARNAAGETLLTFASGTVAAPIAGLAGLMTMAGRGLGLTNADPADVVRGAQESLTYQPRTEKGQKVTRVIGYPFEKLAQGADWAGGKVAEVTGSPALGAGVNTAIQTAPALLLRRPGGKVKKPTAAAESAAREWTRTRAGVDWNSLPDALRTELAQIASDSKTLSRLDPAAVQRQARLASLNIPATRGQITRDPVQLRVEGNVSATEAGRPIRDIYVAQNKALLENIEGMKPKVGAGTATPEATGQAVQGAARAKLQLQERLVSDLYKKADAAGETAALVDVEPLRALMRSSPDRTHYRWAESWLRQVTRKSKDKQAAVQPRNMKSPAPAEDSALQFLAKSKRGLDLDEALAQGFDRTDLSLPAARVGIKPAFRKGGMTFDEAAQMLDEAGYPVRDARGNYDPNVLIDVLDGELRGRPTYSNQNTRLIAEAEATRRDIGRFAERAREIDPDLVDRLLESQMDDGAILDQLRRAVGETKPPTRLTIRELEDLRKAAVKRGLNGGTEGWYAGQLIRSIDDVTDGAGGKLYKEARAARKAQGLEFEDQAGVARLVENKSRTDPAVPVEQTWRRTVIAGSIQDLRNVKRSLLTGGDAATRNSGKAAWRAIQEETVRSIVDRATRGVGKFEDGTPNITPAALKQAVREVGPERLNEIFGPGASAKFQKFIDVADDIKTDPPAGFRGSSTHANFLVFAERLLSKVPIVGKVGAGGVAAVGKLKQMGEASGQVRAAQVSPITEQALSANKLARGRVARRNALIAAGIAETERQR